MKILNFLLFIICFTFSCYLMVISFLRISENFNLKNIFLNILSYIILVICVHLNRNYLKRFYPKK